jgi:hypothetical protein
MATPGIAYPSILWAVLSAAALAADTGSQTNAADYPSHVYFGDLHVHTAYSFDAYGFGTRLDPAQGYAATKDLLDFAAVTDHAEFLGETQLCVWPGSPGYDLEQCERLRAGDTTVIPELAQLCLNDPPLIDPAVCSAATARVWDRIKAAADASYVPGVFTTFIGYEYTLEPPGDKKLHRNVIFSGSNVPAPIPRSEERDPYGLWQSLKATCLPSQGCDVVVIPHTTNASRGDYFSVVDDGGQFMSVQEATLRGDMERLVEIYQNKGNSECYPGVNTTDEGCEFEKLPLIRVVTDPPNGTEVPRQSWAREGLKLGIGFEELFGVNPFQLGFIGGTDTHNSIGGLLSEEGYVGDSGHNDDTIEKRMGSDVFAAYSPGGIAAVWSTENTREAIFAALKRREVYATSGTRIITRFFGGWRMPADICRNPRLPVIGYNNGVPMGSVLPARTTQKPLFVVTGQQDPGSAGITQLQIIKGWSEQNQQFEHVYTVKQSPAPGGESRLCTVWKDDDFNPQQHAFYYARIIEATTPRWSSYDCEAAGVDCDIGPPPGLERCCDGTVPMTLEERAWTSPIWYVP